MIEQGMIFALGFLVASLLSLVFLPVVSRRAMRLAMRRLSMLVPLSMAEIVAERDQIRAEHAAATRRLEQKIEALTHEKADAMGEAGRHATRIFVLEHEGAGLAERNTGLQAGLDVATRTAHEAEAELGLQMQLLHDTLGLAERRLSILNTLQGRLAASAAVVDEQRATIAGLETRGTGQDLRMRTLMAQNAATAADLKDAHAATAAVTLDLGVARAEIALLASKRDELQASLEAARETNLDGERRFAAQAEEIAGLASRVARQSAETVSAQRLLADLLTRHEALQSERDALAERRAKTEADAAARAIVPQPGSEDDLAVLRQTIATLAADMLRVSQEQNVPDQPEVSSGSPQSDAAAVHEDAKSA